MNNLFLIFLSAFLINNVILMRFLGLCPFFGVSKEIKTATSMGMSVIFVMTLATVITWFLYNYVLVPLNLIYLRTVVFILVIASLVQFLELFFKKQLPALYSALGIFLPLITTNCVILGVAFLTIDNKFNLIEGIVFAISNGLGFLFAIILMGAIRERLEIAPIPRALKGLPIAFIVAALMGIAFLGFSGFLGLSI
ncbi:MAG: RnfABCDGE type electron transport complex subunit A [candidate division WOR-3 bacterium]